MPANSWTVTVAFTIPFLLAAQNARAAVKSWIGSSGNWTTGANWSPTGAPDDGDDAFIVSADAVNRTITFNDTSPILRIYRSVRMDSTGTGLVTLQQNNPDTTVNADFLYIANAARGAYNLAAGGGIFGASEINAQGALDVAFGAIFRSGSFTQNGGTIQSFGEFTVSNNYTYNSGGFNGVLTAANFIQNGATFPGSVFVNGQLTLNPVNSTISGGVTNYGPLSLPAGRSFTVGSSYIQLGSTFTQSGNVSIATVSLVGAGGSWNQIGGLHTTRVLVVGSPDGPGSYSIGPGAQLNADGMEIGLEADGTYTQTGGTVVVDGNLIRGSIAFVPSRTTWTMTGGSFTHNGRFVIGTRDAISATYTQTAGTTQVRFLTLNDNASTSASLNLAGGSFIADQDAISHGTINQTGGNMQFRSHLDGSGEISVTGGELRAVRLRQGSAFVGGAGALVIEPPANGVPLVNRVKSLVLQETGNVVNGTLDLTSNHLLIDYTGATPIAAVRRYLTSGYAGGNWNGTGVRSSGAGGRALGYAEASNVLGPFGGVFGDVFADPTSIIIRFTRYGDADLNGVVNSDDFNRLASSFGLSGMHWFNGDFNYSGIVSSDDFNLFASNFGLSAGADGVVDPEDWAALAAAVPEPSTALLLLGGLATSFASRRRAQV